MFLPLGDCVIILFFVIPEECRGAGRYKPAPYSIRGNPGNKMNSACSESRLVSASGGLGREDISLNSLRRGEETVLHNCLRRYCISLTVVFVSMFQDRICCIETGQVLKNILKAFTHFEEHTPPYHRIRLIS